MKKSLAKITSLLLAMIMISSSFVAALADGPSGNRAAYTLTFDANGGTDAPEPQVSVNGEITITKSEPVRTGYDFRGWKYDDDLEEEPNPELKAGNTITLTGNKVAVALWGRRLTYNPNGGVFAEDTADLYGGLVRKISYEDGSITIMNNEPTYSDEKGTLTFLGWSYNQGALVPDPELAKGNTITLTERKTVYAVWGVSVIYDYNGGRNGSDNGPVYDTKTFTAPSTITDPLTADFTITDIEPTRSQMLFDDWNTQIDPPDYRREYNYDEIYISDPEHPENNISLGEYLRDDPAGFAGKSYNMQANDRVTLTRDLVLHAVWLKKLTYNANGGTNAPEISISDGSGDVLITKNKPTWDGHVFLGWSFDKDATEPDSNLVPDSKININDDSVIVYAVWGVELIYDANGGENAPAPTYSSGKKENEEHEIYYEVKITSDAPTMEGRILLGWADEAGATEPQYQPGETIAITESKTVYAVWGVGLRYDPNGGTISESYTFADESGNVTITDEEPTRQGYTFLGWSYDKNATEADPELEANKVLTIANSKTIYAVWGQGLIYNPNGGTFETKYSFVDENGEVTVTSDEPLREKYIFLGWSYSKNATAADPDLEAGKKFKLNESKDVYAVWGLGLSYDPNGGTDKPDPVIITNFDNAEVTITALKPSKDGFVFLGWSKNPGALTPDPDLAAGKKITLTESITIYAIWGIEFIYDANGGTNAPASVNSNSIGEVKISSKEPTKEGYLFLGWATESDAVLPNPVIVANNTVTITEKTTVYAVWGVGLKYDSNGGINAPDPMLVDAYSGVEVTISEEEPTRKGYIFDGWSYDKNATKHDADLEAGKKITLNGSKIIYAVWVSELIYDANDGAFAEGTAGLDGNVVKDKSDGKGTVTIISDEPTKDGYTFVGWSASSATDAIPDPRFKAGKTVTIAGETTLYAVWGGTLTFELNGGENTPNSIVDKGAVKLPSDKPTKRGYTLIGWDTEANKDTTDPAYKLWKNDETGASVPNNETYDLQKDTTLYAVWGGKLSYDANGGKQAPGFQVMDKNGECVISRIEPLRTGYTFLGWSDNDQATTPKYKYESADDADKKITVTHNVTLYALWIKNSDIPKEYKISYDANGGDHAPASGKYSGSFNLPTDTPTREGYTFLGWSESKSATTPKYRGGDAFTLSKDTVLYAVWKENDNSYLNNPNWTDMSTSQMDAKYEDLQKKDPESSEDKFIAVFYSENSDRSKNIGSGLLTQWMDEYDCPLYGVNIHDDKNNVSDWVREKYGDDVINPSLVVFVERVETEILDENGKPVDKEVTVNVTILDGLDFEDDATEDALKDEFFDFWGYAGEYTLIYNANANDAGNLPATETDLEPGNFTLSAQAPVRAGYDFDGWSENSGAKNGEYKPGAKYFIDGETKNITLYAIWKHNPLAFREQDNWHEATRDQIDELYYSEKKGDKSDDFIVYFYDPTSEDCKTIGTTVIAPWITADDGAPDTRENPDGYGYEVYGVDIRNYSIPDWAYGEGSTSVSVPMISFVGYWDHPDPSDKRADEDLPKVKAFSGLSSGGKENLSSIDPVDTYFLTFAENTETEKYELKYDSNGANVTIDSQLGYGIVTLSAENPEYPLDGSEDTGYKFLGWSDDATARLADYKKGDKFNLYENTTLYAIWQKNPEKKYTITYQVEEDAYGPIDLQAEKGWVTLSGVTPTRKGYTFVEWSDAATGKTYKPGADFFLDKDVTLKAMWNYTSKEYTLTFDLDGGDSQARPFPPVTGSGYISLPVDKPVRDDYTFLGWSTTKGGSAQYDAGASFNLTANTTLYAVWEYAHETGGTITYFANGGVFKIDGNTKTNFTESVYKNEDITLTSVKPTRAGYTFLGWSQSATAKSARYLAGGKFYVDGDKNVKLYAVWIDNETLLKVLTLEKSEFTVTKGESITVPYRVNTDYDYLTLVVETPDEDVAAVSNNNGESFVITGKGVGEKVITLTLYDKDTGEVFAVRYINVTVQKYRFSFWKWIISIFRKIFSWFKPLFS